MKDFREKLSLVPELPGSYQMKKLIHEIDESIEIIIIDHEKLPELITK